MAKNCRDYSRQNWNSYKADAPTVEEINCGSLQRIADATELMASNYTKLQKDLETYKRWYNDERATAQSLSKTIAALRGHITRNKNKARSHCPGCNCKSI